ncbi:WD repeat-containing protein 43 [Onthophagus taurus]|uniref:WD repeat-containing protein 43 n=1 Tax=Onthophagus taurus TaxID=166361 RepID=UPI0039BE4A8C
MASQFSKDGKYFATLSVDGKLKIWNTLSNKLEQEYIPNCHLSCPCTCLQFVETQTTHKKDVSPSKKKRRSSLASCSQYVILGTNTGLLLGYSLSTSSIAFTINSKTNKVISCLSWDLDTKIYAGIEQSVYVFNIQDLSVIDKWKCETNNISAIKLIPGGKLLTAFKRIKLWDIKSKEILKTYTGHSSDVFVMEYIKPKQNSEDYFITGSKGDRLLSCWSLNQQNSDQNAISTFLMDDVVDNVAVFQSGNGTTYFAALTRGGSIYFYQHILNGRCKAPLKPQTVIQIASNSNVQKEQKAQVIPVPILGVKFQEDFVITICYGSHTHLTFETVTITHNEKIQCLVRNENTISKISKSDQNNTNVQRPIVGNDVHYITPHATPSSIALKRKSGGSGTSEVPMEKRLENLMLTKSDEKVPKVTNLSQLLIQGIHSRDKSILQTVLNKKDEKTIRNTVQRLPISAVISLLHELNEFVNGKTFSCSIASIWIKHILEIHSGVLLSNPKLSELLEPMSKCIEKRLILQMPLNKLQGRLGLLMSQVNKDDLNDESDDVDGVGTEILNYIDKSSDSDSDIENMDTSLQQSENEWSEEDENVEENGNSLSDDDEVVMLSDDDDST